MPDGLVEEATQLLRRLIRARTSNPPGNETSAAAVLSGYLGAQGVPHELVGADEARVNLVSRIDGRGRGPSLLLLSHLDTADADPDEWSVGPWTGAVRSGSVWGRGALDLKGQAAAQAVALASLVRAGVVLAGDVALAATADEESGSGFGTVWLCDHQPRWLDTDFAVTHGAGDRVVLDGRVVYFCANAERARTSFTLRLRSPAGLTMLGPDHNVVHRASRAVAAIGGQHSGGPVPDEVRAALVALTGEAVAPPDLAATAGMLHPAIGALLTPLAGPTLVARSFHGPAVAAGRPSMCEVAFDCWLLPGQSRREVEQIIASAMGPQPYELSWGDRQGGTRSPPEGPFWQAIESFVDEVDPGSIVLPVCDAGLTDSHLLREAFGTVAYGFFPMREMTTSEAARRVHGPDEHMPIADLALQVDFYRHLMLTLCGV